MIGVIDVEKYLKKHLREAGNRQDNLQHFSKKLMQQSLFLWILSRKTW